MATLGLARTLCQSTFTPINVLLAFAEKQIGPVMLGTWAWPKACPLPHNFFQRLIICFGVSLFYMFYVWLCAKTELRLILQSSSCSLLLVRIISKVKLNQKGRRRAVLMMLCVFNGLRKHSCALQDHWVLCPSLWMSVSSEVIIIAFSWIPPAIVAYVVREREAGSMISPLSNEHLPPWHEFSNELLFRGPPQFEAPATDPWWKRPLEEIQTFWNWIFSICICINYDILILYSFIFVFKAIIACGFVITFWTCLHFACFLTTFSPQDLRCGYLCVRFKSNYL